MARTVLAVGRASTATNDAPATRSATDVAAPTRSLRDNTVPSMRTALSRSCPAATTAGLREVSSMCVRLLWAGGPDRESGQS